MIKPINLKNKTFAIYGMGLTGISVKKFLNKNGVKKYFIWDDTIYKKDFKKKKIFSDSLKNVDYIIISPGINIIKSVFKNKLLKYKYKIITDLDLFFATNKIKKSIVVTGTNGKSTTCALINHILKHNKYKTCLAGNIGKPILEAPFDKKRIYVIEASSFQLAYSKHIQPKCALILNITNDHLDWHGTKKNYVESKFNIFKYQNKNQIAFLRDKKLKDYFKKKKFQSKLRFICNVIPKRDRIEEYLKTEINLSNLEFVYSISNFFKIKKKNFYNSLKSFKGLPHRQEVFLKKNNLKFINDSKATTFESAKFALSKYENIVWILGGLPKLNDKFKIGKFKSKIIKAYIIGNYANFFKKQLNRKIKYTTVKKLENVVKAIFKKFNNSKKNINILFSPASASFDQYKNFVDRGNKFKKIVKYYA